MPSPILIKKNSFAYFPILFPDWKASSQIIILTHSPLLDFYLPLWSEAFKLIDRNFSIIKIPVGESAKSIFQAMRCWKYLQKQQVDRQAILIGIGGGVICDLTGFIASHYMRGVHSYYIPTSLTAMIDAALGDKTGINACGKKNLIGTFYSPQGILIDPLYLRTLPKRELYSGMAEIIKYGMIEDPSLLIFLEKNHNALQDPTHFLWEKLISWCVEIKKKFTEKDLLDQLDIRIFLNYGHTFGHAIESITSYRTYSHGEAVSIGMSCAAHLSLKLGLTDALCKDYQDYMIHLFNLPFHLPQLNSSRFIQLMKGDKKSLNGKISLILPERIGKVLKVVDVDPVLIKQTLLAKMSL